MSKKKAGTLSIKKTKKKPTLAVREPQPGWIQEFNKLSEPFRLIPWDARKSARKSLDRYNNRFYKRTLKGAELRRLPTMETRY